MRAKVRKIKEPKSFHRRSDGKTFYRHGMVCEVVDNEQDATCNEYNGRFYIYPEAVSESADPVWLKKYQIGSIHSFEYDEQWKRYKA